MMATKRGGGGGGGAPASASAGAADYSLLVVVGARRDGDHLERLLLQIESGEFLQSFAATPEREVGATFHNKTLGETRIKSQKYTPKKVFIVTEPFESSEHF